MDLVIRFLVGANQAAIQGKLFVCCAGNHYAVTIILLRQSLLLQHAKGQTHKQLASGIIDGTQIVF